MVRPDLEPTSKEDSWNKGTANDNEKFLYFVSINEIKKKYFSSNDFPKSKPDSRTSEH